MKNYLFIFKHCKKYLVHIVLIITLTLSQSFMDLLLPTLLAGIIDTGILGKNTDFIWSQGMLMFAISLLNLIMMIGVSILTAKFALGLSRDLRASLFRKIQQFSPQDMQQFGTSSYINRTTNDVQQLSQTLPILLRMGLLAPALFIGSLTMALRINGQLSLILIVAVPILIGFITIVLWRAVPRFKQLRDLVDRITQVVSENLNGVRVIRAFNKDQYENERFDEVNRNFYHVSVSVFRTISLMQPIMMLMINTTCLIVIWFGAQYIQAGSLDVGNLIAVVQYTMQILVSLMFLSFVFVMFPQVDVAAQRMNDVLSQKNIQDFPADADDLAKVHSVAFENVSFKYPEAEKHMLTDFNLEAKTGEKIAIIGATGSGKSTLINLLIRFFDASEGTIRYNDQDIKTIGEHTLREQVALVPQNRNLFTGTIADNLRFGHPDATEEEMIRALQLAEAWEFVSKLDDQLQATVDHGGDNFSGGQKQRLAIARALIKPASIFIFDDSFSALDYRTEARLRQNLRELNANAIVFVVAQRISSVVDATRIYVLDEGHIVGVGTHEALKQTNTIYQEIIASQSRIDEEGGDN